MGKKRDLLDMIYHYVIGTFDVALQTGWVKYWIVLWEFWGKKFWPNFSHNLVIANTER